ncbi:MAG: hypothetical protein OXU61_08765, partial [Gammaproteobacteria bacterium]|nr:hypothetical protein [Gammaproteobacteria bacterium]
MRDAPLRTQRTSLRQQALRTPLSIRDRRRVDQYPPLNETRSETISYALAPKKAYVDSRQIKPNCESAQSGTAPTPAVRQSRGKDSRPAMEGRFLPLFKPGASLRLIFPITPPLR